jgi:hypothetical protein
MKQNETVEVELLPSVDSILRRGIDERTLDGLVQHKVAEIMADRDCVVFEPFFRSRRIADELRRLQTMPERRKWSVYYERYGCLICETQKRMHVGNGMCARCYARTFNTLKQIIAEETTGETAHASSRALLPANDQGWCSRPRDTDRSGVHRRWNKRRKRKSNRNQSPPSKRK